MIEREILMVFYKNSLSNMKKIKALIPLFPQLLFSRYQLRNKKLKSYIQIKLNQISISSWVLYNSKINKALLNQV